MPLFKGLKGHRLVCEAYSSPSETHTVDKYSGSRRCCSSTGTNWAGQSGAGLLIDAFDESVDLRNEMTLQPQAATALEHSGSWSCVWSMLALAIESCSHFFDVN